MVKFRPDLALGARSDIGDLFCAAKFIGRLPDDMHRLLRVASLMFVVNRQLLVRFIARTRKFTNGAPATKAASLRFKSPVSKLCQNPL